MGKGIKLASIAGWVAVSLTATSAQPIPDFSAVREFIKTEMGVGTGTPSIAVAVARGNEILWEEGFGWVDHPGGTVATKDTLYYSASVTKAITATALMILSERKQLDWDRPANLYLKTAKLRSPYWNADEATVRRIATHTAGLATYDSAVRMAITPAGEVQAMLGKQAAVNMTNVRVRDNRITGRMPGDLSIDYAGGSPYELRFELYRHDNRLIGSAYTNAVPGRDGPRLPFWVDLKRGGP